MMLKSFWCNETCVLHGIPEKKRFGKIHQLGIIKIQSAEVNKLTDENCHEG